jgi:hypothetical protein
MADATIIDVQNPDVLLQPGPWDVGSFCAAGIRNAGYGIEPPFLTSQNPANAAISVPLTSTIDFTVTDALEGVRLSTVQVFINVGAGSVTAYLSSSFQNGYSGTVTPVGLGFAFAITPPAPFPGAQLIQVRVVAFDQSAVPNQLDTTYSFTSAQVQINTPITASNEGYGPVDLTGTVPVGIYVLHVGPNGDSTDPMVYNGVPGSGGEEVTFVSIGGGLTRPTKPIFLPPLPIGGPYDITFGGDSSFVIEDVVTVVPSSVLSKTLNLRSTLPRQYATGPRSIGLKRFPQE